MSLDKIALMALLAISHVFAFAQSSDEKITLEVSTMLDNWHADAAKANYENYFNALADDAVFIGTDPTEHWNKSEFKKFCKPYFDKHKTWHFTSLERHIYMNESKTLIWFDELLDTQMKLCRGSGVSMKVNNEWKILQYVLSIAVPNSLTKQLTVLKTEFDDSLKIKLLKN
jgi:hypothetical protein